MGAILCGAMTDSLWNLDISLFILLPYFLSLSLLYFCLHSLPVGKRGLVLVMRGEGENCEVGEYVCWGLRSSNKIVSSLPPLESPRPSSASVLHAGLAEDLCIWVTLVVGGDTGVVGPFSFFL